MLLRYLSTIFNKQTILSLLVAVGLDSIESTKSNCVFSSTSEARFLVDVASFNLPNLSSASLPTRYLLQKCPNADSITSSGTLSETFRPNFVRVTGFKFSLRKCLPSNSPHNNRKELINYTSCINSSLLFVFAFTQSNVFCKYIIMEIFTIN